MIKLQPAHVMSLMCSESKEFAGAHVGRSASRELARTKRQGQSRSGCREAVLTKPFKRALHISCISVQIACHYQTIKLSVMAAKGDQRDRYL